MFTEYADQKFSWKKSLQDLLKVSHIEEEFEEGEQDYQSEYEGINRNKQELRHELQSVEEIWYLVKICLLT